MYQDRFVLESAYLLLFFNIYFRFNILKWFILDIETHEGSGAECQPKFCLLDMWIWTIITRTCNPLVNSHHNYQSVNDLLYYFTVHHKPDRQTR